MPGDPRGWPFATEHVDVEATVDRLVVVSDLHAAREPLDAFDEWLSAQNAGWRLFLNGDLFEGGIDPEHAVAWAMRHALGRTTFGNHEGRIFAYLQGTIAGASASLWARDGELGAYELLADEQLRFVEELPDVLEIHWRGLTIWMLHGHQNPKNVDYTDWRLTPDDLMYLFGEASVDLTIIGHTHYPFVMERDGARLANSGSISAPLCRFHDAQGQLVNRCVADPTVPDDDSRSSFLIVTEADGRLHVEIERFDYDRQALLARYERLDGLRTPAAARRKLVLEGFLDAELMRATNGE